MRTCLSITAIFCLAAFSASAGEANSKTNPHQFSAEDRSWWAVQPVADPATPAEAGKNWARNGIDRFVARRLDEAGLAPAAAAGKRELVRRAYFDLHGLPPTPEQVEAFVEDSRPDAWEKLIDQLLASPRYGERWGQHWLDVVRWAESDGYNQDAFRPQAWPYRDYVIKSFNDDKPYDRFVREQLAGDELDPANPEVMIGTAFLRNGIYEFNQRDVRTHWGLIVDELTRVTSETFLGLGLGCAQCHDHKFDPLLQEDYFAMQAFLAPVRWRFDLTLADADEQQRYEKKLADWKKATAGIRSRIDKILEPRVRQRQAGQLRMFPADIQELYARAETERSPYEQQLVELTDIQIRYERTRFDEKKRVPEADRKRLAALRAELAKFDHLKPEPLPPAFVATDIRTEAPKVWLESRDGNVEVGPAFPALLETGRPDIAPTENSTGRRLALAEWITRADNPFATRVIVNRLWQYHFAQGIVATPNDFGTLGEAPSHPELLDWLTTRFLEGGWKIKPLHRLIMNSAVYRQTARREPGETESATDPGNRLLWRYPPLRLDAEQIRDAMLVASGEMVHRLGGESVEGAEPRRSVYVKKMRNTPDEMLRGFDAPPGFESTPQRVATTAPTQSLLLINGAWSMERARALARRVLAGKSAIDPAIVREVIATVYGREPRDTETERALAFVRAQRKDAPALPPPPPDKFPAETGLRPADQAFGAVEDIDLGNRSLWLQPGSRFEKLHLEELDLDGDQFTVEAVAVLDNIHPDASVNTIAARWNGGHKIPGWSFGVTSAKSRYQPRNLIVQLVGRDFQDVTVYEVVASDLRVPVGKPVYLAAVISAAPEPDDETAGTVTFYMKDLSVPGAPLQSREVKHGIVRGVQKPEVRILVGGRDQTGHLWDGQLARVAIAGGALIREQLLAAAPSSKAERLVDWTFSDQRDGKHPAPGSSWRRSPSPPAGNDDDGIAPDLLHATTDFCHALMNSNEFLYLH